MKRDPHLVRLSWDHHHGLVLAREIERLAPGADEAGLGGLYAGVLNEWFRAVLPHFHAEEGCLLARLLRYGEASDAVTRTSADHLAIEGFVADMRDAGTFELRRTVMLAFAARLREHIRWEEAVLFDQAQTLLSNAELEAVEAEVAPLLAEPKAPKLGP